MALVEVNKNDHILRLDLNFNDENEGSLECMQAFIDTLKTHADDRDVRVMVLGSAIKGFFSSGLDPSIFPGKSADEIRAAWKVVIEVFNALFFFPRPTVAKIQGHALALGGIFALACDYRYMGEKAGRIGFPESLISMNITPSPMVVLKDLVGPTMARDMIYLARRFKPAEAKEIGLLTDVFPDDQVEERVNKHAQKLAGLTVESARGIKRAFTQNYVNTLTELDEWAVEEMVETTLTPNAQEGFSSLAEGRKAVFKE